MATLYVNPRYMLTPTPWGTHPFFLCLLSLFFFIFESECQTLDYLRFQGIKFVVSERDFVNLTHWQVLPDGSIVVCASTAVSARESDVFLSQYKI